MCWIVKTQLISNFLILLICKIDQSFSFQRYAVQYNLLWGLLIVNGKKIG